MPKRYSCPQKKSYSKAFIIFLLIGIIGFSNCIVKPPSKKSDNTLPLLALLYIAADNASCKNSRGDFWVRNVITNESYCLKTTLQAESNYAKLYVENNLSTGLNYSSLLTTYDNQIINREIEAFGSPSDIDQDGKVNIVVLDIIDGATSSSGFVAGFFDPINFYTDDPNEIIRSNEKEILYMDGKELVQLEAVSPGSFLSTIAHELQHLIRFQYEAAVNAEDATWINEGTSEVASDITGFGPQTSRISCFRGSSSSCSGGISGTSIINWSSALKNYAYAYSFMKYIYENSGTTTAQKYAFFKKTVTGNSSGIRADNASDLMEVFKSASSYNASIVNPNSSNSDMFKRMLTSFLGQSLGYSSITNTYFGNTSLVSSIDSVRSTYPLPTDIAGLYSNGGFSTAGTGPVSASISPSVAYRLAGTTTGVTSGGSNFVVVKNTSNDYLLFNGASSGSTTETGRATLLEPIDYPRLELHGDRMTTVCPNAHLHTVHAIQQKKGNLKLFGL